MLHRGLQPQGRWPFHRSGQRHSLMWERKTFSLATAVPGVTVPNQQPAAALTEQSEVLQPQDSDAGLRLTLSGRLSSCAR